MGKKRNTNDEAATTNDASPFVAEITRTADEEVERILSRARRTAETRLGTAKDQVNAETGTILETAKTRVEVERRRIVSDLNLEMKKIVLKARGELVKEVLNRVRERLERSRGTPEYRAMLKALVIEGIAALDRPEVSVSVSTADEAMANSAFFKEVAHDCGRPVNITSAADLDERAMGAIVRAADGSVLFDNTIAARMERLADELHLIVSREVFGDEPAEAKNT